MSKKVSLIEKDEDGWWAYYLPGFSSSLDPKNLHLEHEDTKSEILRLVSLAVPCDCPQCRREIITNV